MKISRTSKKVTSILLSLLMLVSLLSAGFVANAATNTLTGTYDSGTGQVVVTSGWTGLTSQAFGGAIIVFDGDQRTAVEALKVNASTGAITGLSTSGLTYEVLAGHYYSSTARWKGWWGNATILTEFTYTTGLAGVTVAVWNAAGNGPVSVGYIASSGDPVYVYNNGTNVSGGSVNANIADKKVALTYQSDASSVTWSYAKTSGAANFSLSSTTDATTELSFDDVGTATVTATTNLGRSASVTVTVGNDGVVLDLYNGTEALASNSLIDIEQGLSLIINVDCPDADKLTVTRLSGTSAIATKGTAASASSAKTDAADSATVPVTITGVEVGVTTFQFAIYGKTVNLRINITEATAAKFYKDGELTGPMVFVPAGTSLNITSSLDVDSWNASGTDITVVSNGVNGCTITAGSAIGSIVKVEALNSSGEVIGWFDVYISDGSELFSEIILYDNYTAASDTYQMSVGDTVNFAALCSIIVGSTEVEWTLTGDCASLDTTATDVNGNTVAIIEALSEGSCELKYIANGVAASITIEIEGEGTAVVQYKSLGLKTWRSVSYYEEIMDDGTVNGRARDNEEDLQTINYNGGTMVPFRMMGNALGAIVAYNANFQDRGPSVGYTVGNDTLILFQDSTDALMMKVDTDEFTYYSIEGYEPLRILGEAGSGRAYVHTRLISDKIMGLTCMYDTCKDEAGEVVWENGTEVHYVIISTIPREMDYLYELDRLGKNNIAFYEELES